MSITHSWNGTVLTVTSDSGTSSADLKGDTGCRGPQGPAGIVYDENGNIIMEGYATEQYVDDKLAQIEVPEVDMTNYYTKSEVDAKVNNIDIPEVDLTGYATQEYVDEQIVNVATGGAINLDNYYTKTEMDAQLANTTVEVDGKTILQGSNGIYTAIGGSYTNMIFVERGLNAVMAQRGVGVPVVTRDNIHTYLPNLTYKVKIVYSDGLVETGTITKNNTTSNEYQVQYAFTEEGSARIDSCYVRSWLDERADVFGVFPTSAGVGYTIAEFYLWEGQLGYSPIDANFIPVDGTSIIVNDEGKLSAVGGSGDSGDYVDRAEFDQFIQEIDDRDYATMEYVNNLALGGEGGGVDLSIYVERTELDEYKQEVSDSIDAVYEQMGEKIRYSTTDLTAGASALATGVLYVVYE